jgi:hypothetical protein
VGARGRFGLGMERSRTAGPGRARVGVLTRGGALDVGPVQVRRQGGVALIDEFLRRRVFFRERAADPDGVLMRAASRAAVSAPGDGTTEKLEIGKTEQLSSRGYTCRHGAGVADEPGWVGENCRPAPGSSVEAKRPTSPGLRRRRRRKPGQEHQPDQRRRAKLKISARQPESEGEKSERRMRRRRTRRRDNCSTRRRPDPVVGRVVGAGGVHAQAEVVGENSDEPDECDSENGSTRSRRHGGLRIGADAFAMWAHGGRGGPSKFQVGWLVFGGGFR